MSKKKTTTEEPVEVQSVELFGVTHKFNSMDYFTPNMRMQLAEILDRMTAHDISNAQAVQEMGLLLTHHPKSRRAVSYNRYNNMLMQEGQSQLFEEVIAAGNAVFSVTIAGLKTGEGDADPKAAEDSETTE